MRNWKNVKGRCGIELYRHNDEVFDALKDRKLPSFVNSMPCDAELVLHFTSSGHFDAGSLYGGPDQVGWPPEGNEDRELDSASLPGVELSREQQEELFEFFREEIEAEEIDYDIGGEG